MKLEFGALLAEKAELLKIQTGLVDNQEKLRSERDRLMTQISDLEIKLAKVRTEAFRGKRRALVVGNNSYPRLPIPPLANAVQDALSVGETLEKLGFIVTRATDVNLHGMWDILDEFTEQVEEGDLVLIFYSGHGVGIKGANYLLPVDVDVSKASMVSRVRQMAVAEADVISAVQRRKPSVAVLILDACRNSPLNQPDLAGVVSSRGLVDSEVVRKAQDVFAVYSAGYDQVAADRLDISDSSPNSVFTRSLLAKLGYPNKHLNEIMIDVRAEVRELTRRKQTPEIINHSDRVWLTGLPLVGQRTEPTVTSGTGGPYVSADPARN
jgi:uncharacterized caspase-like protein